MSNLHERLTAAVNARLELARTATPGPWTVEDAYARAAGCRCLSCYEDEPYGRMIPELDGPPRADTSPVLYDHDASFIAANDPATVIRNCERDLKVLERHAPKPMIAGWDRRIVGIDCATCHVPGEDYDDYGHSLEYPCPEIADLATAYGIEVQP